MIQQGRDSRLALSRARKLKAFYSSKFHSDQLIVHKSNVKKKHKLIFRSLAKYSLIKESKNYFYFFNEQKLVTKLLKKIKTKRLLSLESLEYTYINAFNYKIHRELTSDELNALSWSMAAIHAPKDISQDTLARYLNTSRQTVNKRLRDQVFHKIEHRHQKLGEIDASQKRVINNLFHEIKNKREGEAKIILKKNHKTQKVEILAVLTNEYKKKKNFPVSENRRKGVIQKSFKRSFIKLIKDGLEPCALTRTPKVRLKSKFNQSERSEDLNYKQWTKNKKMNVSYIKLKNGKRVIYKYEYYKSLTSNVQKSLDKIKGILYLEEYRRLGETFEHTCVDKNAKIIQLPIKKRLKVGKHLKAS